MSVLCYACIDAKSNGGERDMFYNEEISKRLSKINLDFKYGEWKFKTYWCRVVMNERAPFNTRMHSHSFFELHLCLQGESNILSDGKECVLKAGNYLIFDRSQKHKVLSRSLDFEEFVWGVDVLNEAEGEWLDRFSAALQEGATYVCDEVILNLLSLIFSDVAMRQECFSETVKIKLYLLFFELLRQISAPKTPQKTISVQTEKDPRMKMIESYINDNILQGVTVGDVSREFSICEKQLSRICLKNCKMPIGKYIVGKKMDKAKELLEETDWSLSEISEALGYSDAYTFGKAFKRQEGMSPIKFRKSIQI